MKPSDIFGKATPVTVTSWSLFGLGLAAAFASRFVAAADLWLGTGLLLIGVAMAVDVLPGGSSLTDEQVVMARHIGIRDPIRAHKWAAVVLGGALATYGAYTIWS